jgi:hypothetical protein
MTARLRDCYGDRSGGLFYHWRAWRYRKRLWLPFLKQLAGCLSAWQPAASELVIVGPSAGYSLPEAFLARFGRRVVLEPDPFARWLLQRRFPSLIFEFGSLDCMADAGGAQALVQDYPSAAFLFSNVIGQRLADLPEDWLPSLLRVMQGRAWASYHDVIASAQAPQRWDAQVFSEEATLEEVLAGFWSGGELALYDHGSFRKMPARVYMPWALSPGRYHLLGWVSSEGSGASDSVRGNSGIGGRS